MASTFEKKFKTTETTKAAGAEVVSDPIELSPRSKDHVITVTADSSCTANVNVELEMSPDGNNWCPAVSRTVGSSGPSQTGDIIGNEESVKLTPDAGEFKNKHARGGLNFDVNGAVVTPDGTGARDLMHQHIATSKSFNYSQWFKTSEAPTTTYKPVLFRHGGYDNFENAKVIETDATSNTQNLCQSLTGHNSVYNGLFNVNSAAALLIESGSDAATFYGTSGDGLNYASETGIGKKLIGVWDPNENFSVSRWNYAKIDGSVIKASGFQRRGTIFQNSTQYMFPYYFDATYYRMSKQSMSMKLITYSNNDAAVKELRVAPLITQDTGGSFYSVLRSNPVITFTKRSDNTTFSVNFEEGYHTVLNYTAPTDITQGIPEANVEMYVNGHRVKINVTTESGTDYVAGAAPSDNLFYGDETYAYNTNWGGDGTLVYSTYFNSLQTAGSYINNHMDFRDRLLSQSDINTLYNNGKLLDFTTFPSNPPISMTGCIMAIDSDYPYYDLAAPSSMVGWTDVSGYGLILKQGWTYTPGRVYQLSLLTTGVGIMNQEAPALNDLFDTTSNLSISGWFKTDLDATGVLFSNTEGAAASGLKLDVNASDMTINFIATSAENIAINSDVNDGQWHHLVITKNNAATNQFTVYVDGAQVVQDTATISDTDLRGLNGLTLLSDGQNNAIATSPAATDASKLNSAISNWSVHSEVLSANAVKQLYSNGHVRNIKNLPSVTASAIKAWWQLADTTNPENDVSGQNIHLEYQDGVGAPLTAIQVDATEATLVEDSINGNAMTLSLTKSFNFTTNEWVSTADQDTALCLSFNGFEEQAEYFALWKCSQTIAGSVIDICDGEWHNVILSYRGKNDLAGDNVDPGDTVKFGPGPANNLAFNWAISYDGEPLTAIQDGSGADYIGGLNTLVTDTYSSTTYNVGFAIQDRHLKYETSNTEEEYKPHAQFSAGIHEVVGVDNNNAFQGYVDETSFHSDTWWVDQAGTSVITNTFNQEKPATIYGSTTALTNRGASTEYPVGVPYPLLNPEKLNTSGQASDIEGSNQYINPNRYDASTNPNGGLEGWWRWGDTPGDCSITINDARDHEASINARDIDAFGIVTADRQLMTSADSIFNADATASSGGGTTITFPQVKVEGVQTAICNLANINSPLLQFVRVKWTGAGSCDLGDGKGEAKICFTNRRKRR